MHAQPRTVLVVDDAEEVRFLISHIIARRGYQVMTACDGREALHVLGEEEGNKPDLILLDVMMPRMNGYETLLCIRQRGIRTPVVMLTALSSDRDMIRGYQEDVEYYMPKPFRNQTLLDIVDYLIGDLSEEERGKLETRI